MATLAELTERKALYLAAEAKILAGQEYTIADGVINRRLRRADLDEVRAAIKDLDAQIAAAQPASANYRRVYRGVPGC